MTENDLVFVLQRSKLYTHFILMRVDGMIVPYCGMDDIPSNIKTTTRVNNCTCIACLLVLSLIWKTDAKDQIRKLM